jgi:hypothetical protein
MIRKSMWRFSEKHALGLDPRDHAPTKSSSAMTIPVIALESSRSGECGSKAAE